MLYRCSVVRLVLEQGYRASRADEASAAVQAVFGVGMVTVEALGSLQYDQWSLVDDGISATHIKSRGAVVHLHAAPAPDMVVIAVRSGYVVLKQDAETVALQAGDLGLIPLDQAIRASWEQVTMDLYSFPRSSLGYLLSSDPEHLALHVARLKAVSPALVELWTRTAASLTADILENAELVASDVIREQAIETLLGLTIEAFGISDANEDNADDRARLEAADAYMRGNLAKAISVTDVARAVGVSIHGLQLAFQRTGTPTPLAHLRAMRMTAAQHTLTAATTPVPIIEVARSLGYSNLGRFTAHYLDAFGTLPEHDLDQAVSASTNPS